MNKFTKWWMTPKFPEIHLDDNTSFLKKWFFHPIKRRVARFYLKFLQKFTDIKVIAITGSAGKTTTKDLLSGILSLGGKTAVTIANIDPIYNIPTTILKTPIGTKYLVLEMGVEYPMEMDFYLWLASPDVGVITNIFPTHLKFMKSIEGVLEEKSKLVTSLSKNGIAVLNSGDKNLKKLAKKIKAKIVWVKSNKDPSTQDGFIASYVASELGFSIAKIKKGLANFKKPLHRMNWIELTKGAIVFDDSYNSNPEALLSTAKVFNDRAGKNEKVAVIGDMLELGKDEIEYHKKIGAELAKYNFRAVIGVGELSKHLVDEINSKSEYTKTYLVKNALDVKPILNQYLEKGFYIFVKGSRSIGLDRLVDNLV